MNLTLVQATDQKPPTVHHTDVQPLRVDRGTVAAVEFGVRCSCGWSHPVTVFTRSAAEERARAHVAIKTYRAEHPVESTREDIIALVVEHLEVYAACAAVHTFHPAAKREAGERIVAAVLALSGYGDGSADR